MNVMFINAIRSYLSGEGAVILPEIELLLFGLGILLIDFWIEQKEKYLNAGLALAGTLFSAFTLWRLRGAVAARGGFLGFHQSAIIDSFFIFFGALFLAATALVILLSVKYLEIEKEQEGEYYALLLFACIGMMFMASGVDLIVMFLGLETMALSFYVLTGFLRREKRSNEAALKYVLLGAFSSAILAYGFSLLYGLSAFSQSQMRPSTNIGQIGAALENRLRMSIGNGSPDWLAILAFVTVLAGLFFKIGAVPFHQWAPDVYEGAPTPISAYVSVASKTASFALLLRLMFVFGSTHVAWMYLVAGVAVASLTWGNLAALTQTNVKRLLAYSSISHVGYILLGLVAGNNTAFTGIAFYLFAYVFMTAGAFAVVIVLSLAGIPPTAGFMGKYFIFLSLIETHHPLLAVFAVLYIVPALYYYFRIVVHAWLKQPGEAPRPSMTSAQAVALGIAVFVTLAAGLYPEPFTRLAKYAFGQ